MLAHFPCCGLGDKLQTQGWAQEWKWEGAVQPQSSFSHRSEESPENSLEAAIATGVLKQGREKWRWKGLGTPTPIPSPRDWPRSQGQPLHHTDDWNSHNCSQLFSNSGIVIGHVFLQYIPQPLAQYQGRLPLTQIDLVKGPRILNKFRSDINADGLDTII